MGRPTPYSGGENTENWQKAVRASIADKRFTAPANGARLAVRIEFRLRLEHDSYEPDPDNLLKSTFDAMDGVLGLRKRKGKPEADDERIDYLEVLKRQAREDEEWGATIEVYALEEPEN